MMQLWKSQWSGLVTFCGDVEFVCLGEECRDSLLEESFGTQCVDLANY